MIRIEIPDVNLPEILKNLDREELNLSLKLQHIERVEEVDKVAPDEDSIFNILYRICRKVDSNPHHWCTVSFLLDPRPLHPFVTVYVNLMYPESVINPLFMDRIKAKSKKQVTDDEVPHCLSWKTKLILEHLNGIVRSHGGRRIGDRLDEGTCLFTYSGPFLSRANLRGYIRTACETAGLPWDSWKKYWRRNSKEIRRDLEPYFDLDSQEFPRWIW